MESKADALAPADEHVSLNRAPSQSEQTLQGGSSKRNVLRGGEARQDRSYPEIWLQQFRLNAIGRKITLATSSQPCCQCYGATIWAGIDTLLIGARSEDVEEIVVTDEHVRAYMGANAYVPSDTPSDSASPHPPPRRAAGHPAAAGGGAAARRC